MEGKSIDITQAVLDAISSSLLRDEEGKVPIDLDMGLVDELLRSWAADFNVALNEQLFVMLQDMVENLELLLENIRNRIEDIFNSTDIAVTMVLKMMSLCLI